MAPTARGGGKTVVLVHPGLDDGSTWARVARKLSRHFRVVRYTRARYRLDKTERVSLGDEVAELCSVAEWSSPGKVAVVGHSSGAIVALEALIARPELFSHAVLYEPPFEMDDPSLGDDFVVRASRAITRRRPDAAVKIFARDIVGLSAFEARVAQVCTVVSPKLRRLAPRQLDDVIAIKDLGNRLAAYATIEVPTLLIDGELSPVRLRQRTAALASTLPRATVATLKHQGHAAQQRQPRQLGHTIKRFLSQHADRTEEEN